MERSTSNAERPTSNKEAMKGKKTEGAKLKATLKSGAKPGFAQYRQLYYGHASIWYVMKAEFIAWFCGSMSGAAGIYWRSKLYPKLFATAGRKIFIGRNVTIRHALKIRLGNNVIIDDNCVIDAKGQDNKGITIGDSVFIGRNTIVYCKNGNIQIKQGTNISSNCTIFSSNKLTIEEDVMIGGYSYLLSGGEYDYTDKTRFADQSGMKTSGPLVIGGNSWLGTRVTVLDAANIGTHCVIGAGAVVVKPIPADSMAVGIPAKVVKSI